mgnify:CR=1 FL=1
MSCIYYATVSIEDLSASALAFLRFDLVPKTHRLFPLLQQPLPTVAGGAQRAQAALRRLDTLKSTRINEHMHFLRDMQLF